VTASKTIQLGMNRPLGNRREMRRKAMDAKKYQDNTKTSLAE